MRPAKRSTVVVKVVALVPDLMDRSRLSAAVEDVAFAGDPNACAGAEVVVVDLSRFSGDVVAAVRSIAPDARIVAFGPHVDEGLLASARDAGADTVLPRSRFFRDPAGALGAPI
jgi:hypothetical protein